MMNAVRFSARIRVNAIFADQRKRISEALEARGKRDNIPVLIQNEGLYLMAYTGPQVQSKLVLDQYHQVRNEQYQAFQTELLKDQEARIAALNDTVAQQYWSPKKEQAGQAFQKAREDYQTGLEAIRSETQTALSQFNHPEMPPLVQQAKQDILNSPFASHMPSYLLRIVNKSHFDLVQGRLLTIGERLANWLRQDPPSGSQIK